MKLWLIERWKGMSRKDQFILIILSIVLSTLLFYTIFWMPISNGLVKLSITIPKKQSQLALMKQQSIELQSKRKRTQWIDTSSNELKNIIEQSARLHKINVELKPLNKQSIGISIREINFNLWIEWVDALQSETGLKINACDISSASQNGEVNITGTLVAAP